MKITRFEDLKIGRFKDWKIDGTLGPHKNPEGVRDFNLQIFKSSNIEFNKNSIFHDPNYMWTNFHTHSTYCDGKTGLQELVQRAEQLGMLCLGLSSHAPLPIKKPWSMQKELFSEYLKEIRALREITVVQLYAGLEIDYIPGKLSPIDFATFLDYTIGSVHFVDYFENGEPWEIDNTHAVFMDGLEKIFRMDIKAAVKRYYQLTREMIRHSSPDVIGHIDKIKMQNSVNKLFDENETWYQREISDTIDVLKQTEAIVEVNTRGIYQKKSETTYPSPWIIEQLFRNSIPVTISSDAHHPKDLTNYFPETAKLLMDIGYKTIHILHDRIWKPYRFNEGGILL